MIHFYVFYTIYNDEENINTSELIQYYSLGIELNIKFKIIETNKMFLIKTNNAKSCKEMFFHLNDHPKIYF